MPNIQIHESDMPTVVALSKQIPAFHNPYEVEAYEKRLTNVPHLILVAFEGEQAVGFKVGYEREGIGFYSWMGGVLPSHHRQGIARKLAIAQENWARSGGYQSITFKTLNRHRAMLHFAIKNGFHFIKIDSHPQIEENRIWLRKDL